MDSPARAVAAALAWITFGGVMWFAGRAGQRWVPPAARRAAPRWLVQLCGLRAADARVGATQTVLQVSGLVVCVVGAAMPFALAPGPDYQIGTIALFFGAFAPYGIAAAISRRRGPRRR